jgi:hypothetical protein
MQVEAYIKAIRYMITEGSQFMWGCYGDAAWFLNSNDIDAVIDRSTGEVYEVSVHDYDGTSYKWIDPSVIDAYMSESESRGFDPWQAYDDVKYEQIKDEQSMLEILIAKDT